MRHRPEGPTQTLVHAQPQDEAGSATAPKGQQGPKGKGGVETGPESTQWPLWGQLVARALVCPSAGQDQSRSRLGVREHARKTTLSHVGWCEAGGLVGLLLSLGEPWPPMYTGSHRGWSHVEQRGSSDHQACSYPCPLAESGLDPRGADPASPTVSSLGPCSLGRSRGLRPPGQVYKDLEAQDKSRSGSGYTLTLLGHLAPLCESLATQQARAAVGKLRWPWAGLALLT